MHVEDLVLAQQRLPDQRTEGAYDKRFGTHPGDVSAHPCIVDAGGLLQRNTELERALGHGGRLEPASPARRAVRAGEHQQRAMALLRGQRGEDRGGELRGAEEDRAHGGAQRGRATR